MKYGIQEVIDIEINSLVLFKKNLGEELSDAIDLISASNGNLIVCGMGKSGHIGKKISATLCSTGTQSFFLHPSEAIHGDLGRVKNNDVILLISNSGETDEIIRIIPSFMKKNIPIISFTSNPNSTIAKKSNIVVNCCFTEEACPLRLAPTSSTTVALVAGDALAVGLMNKNKFKPEEFAVFHPGGSLGRMLIKTVSEEMVSSPLPTNNLYDTFFEVLTEISNNSFGLTVVLDSQNKIAGIITDGDIRKALKNNLNSFQSILASQIMKENPITIDSSKLISEAEKLMREKNINSLLVVKNKQLIGILNQRKIKYGIV
jgi:arabinose-5-phosphate isomerase